MDKSLSAQYIEREAKRVEDAASAKREVREAETLVIAKKANRLASEANLILIARSARKQPLLDEPHGMPCMWRSSQLLRQSLPTKMKCFQSYLATPNPA